MEISATLWLLWLVKDFTFLPYNISGCGSSSNHVRFCTTILPCIVFGTLWDNWWQCHGQVCSWVCQLPEVYVGIWRLVVWCHTLGDVHCRSAAMGRNDRPRGMTLFVEFYKQYCKFVHRTPYFLQFAETQKCGPQLFLLSNSLYSVVAEHDTETMLNFERSNFFITFCCSNQKQNRLHLQVSFATNLCWQNSTVCTVSQSVLRQIQMLIIQLRNMGHTG